MSGWKLLCGLGAAPLPFISACKLQCVCAAQGLVKFDPLLVNAKEASVALSVSADVEAASEDMQHFESTLAALPNTGYKAQQAQPQQPARPKVSESDKRPKKRMKAEDNSHNKSWDSDQSLQVTNNAVG